MEEDEHVLDAARLAATDGPGVQALLRRVAPVPLQEERARLLREVRGGGEANCIRRVAPLLGN